MQIPRLLASAHAPKSLTDVLQESERVRGMVKDSAEALAEVNVVLSEEFFNQNPCPEVESAIERNEIVEIKVLEASEKLLQINQDLESEVEEKHVLEHKLSFVMDQQAQTLHGSLHDVLTGLPNRLLFNDRLEHGIEQAKRHGWTLGVMFMDLDKFKTINDTFGHVAGDDLLRTTANRLKETTRTNDTVSRYGGDEFLYLLMEVDQEQDAAVVAEKIIKAVQAPYECTAGELKVTTSIGISFYPGDGHTAEALIKSADVAMYRAKKSQSGYAFASQNPTLNLYGTVNIDPSARFPARSNHMWNICGTSSLAEFSAGNGDDDFLQFLSIGIGYLADGLCQTVQRPTTGGPWRDWQ